MQHVLQVSRKIDYGLRAMIHLAGLPAARSRRYRTSPPRCTSRASLAKILKI